MSTQASPQAGGSLGTFLLFSLLIPVLAVLVTDLAEWIGHDSNWRDRLSKLGWDCCVLALGATGGILAQPAVVRGIGDGIVLAGVEVVACLVIVGMSLVIAKLRRLKKGVKMTGRRAFVILGIGGAALAIPVFFAAKFWSNL